MLFQVGADVASQAIAQIFSTRYSLPPQHEIDKWCDSHYTWSVQQAYIARSPTGLMNSAKFERWLNQVCGNGLDRKLGWGIEGWKFWWQERELWEMLMYGVDTAFV